VEGGGVRRNRFRPYPRFITLDAHQRTMADPTRDPDPDPDPDSDADADPQAGSDAESEFESDTAPGAVKAASDGPAPVTFTREAGGPLTAHDGETGLARAGHTRAEALARLAEALADAGPDDASSDATSVDPDALLEGEGTLDPDETRRESDLPDFLEER
jgi:hypothetical protein